MEQTASPFTPNSFAPAGRWRPLDPYGESIKRLFDITVAALGLLLLAPVFLYLAIRIRRDSSGPVFYRGARMGRGGKIFHIVKFRTMYERPESYAGPRVTAGDDDRITPYGRRLRDAKLNELPQLWNVLKGEMSLVGPRPEDPEIVAAWPESVRDEILVLRPGITSPASVIYRDEESLLSSRPVMEAYLGEITPSKLRLDQLYVRYHSFLGDLDVLFWTALVLIPQIRARTPGEEQMLFLGPVNMLVRRHIRWFITDTAVTFLAMGVTGLLWRSLGPLNVGLLPAAALACGFAVLFSLANAAQGVNRIEWSRAPSNDALDLLPAAALATAIAVAVNYFYPLKLAALLYGGEMPAWLTRPLLPTGLLLAAAGLSVFGSVLARYRSRLVTGLATRWVNWRGNVRTAQERVLIIGCGETGRYAAWMLAQANYAGALQVVGFVDDDYYKQDLRIFGMEVLGRREHIADIVKHNDVGIILFAIHRISPAERRQVLEICQSTPARVVVFPDIAAALTGLVRAPWSGPHAAPAEHPATAEALPCDLCLAKVSPLKMDLWLAELETAARQGDLDKVRRYVLDYRQQLRGEEAPPKEGQL